MSSHSKFSLAGFSWRALGIQFFWLPTPRRPEFHIGTRTFLKKKATKKHPSVHKQLHENHERRLDLYALYVNCNWSPTQCLHAWRDDNWTLLPKGRNTGLTIAHNGTDAELARPVQAGCMRRLPAEASWIRSVLAPSIGETSVANTNVNSVTFLPLLPKQRHIVHAILTPISSTICPRALCFCRLVWQSTSICSAKFFLSAYLPHRSTHLSMNLCPPIIVISINLSIDLSIYRSIYLLLSIFVCIYLFSFLVYPPPQLLSPTHSKLCRSASS